MNTAGHHELTGRSAFLHQFSVLMAAAIPHFQINSKVKNKKNERKI
jgi:hypothetical protein